MLRPSNEEPGKSVLRGVDEGIIMVPNEEETRPNMKAVTTQA